MAYNRISADCHLDLIWRPPDLFLATQRGPSGPSATQGMRSFSA